MDENRTSIWFWLLPIVTVGLAYGLYYLYSQRERVKGVEDVPAPAPPALTHPGQGPAPSEPLPPDPQAMSPTEDPLPAPKQALEPLDARDVKGAETLAREVLKTLAASDNLANWLAGDELVQRLVIAIDNVAAGRSPRLQATNVALAGSFRVVPSGAVLSIAPESFRRYDAIASLFCSFPTDPTVSLYRRLKPVLQRAFEHIGHPNESFEDALIQAGMVLLATPVPREPIRVVKRGYNYVYADPALEALNEAQKHLLRMGPDNVRRVQGKVREVLLALGVSEQSLP